MSLTYLFCCFFLLLLSRLLFHFDIMKSTETLLFIQTIYFNILLLYIYNFVSSLFVSHKRSGFRNTLPDQSQTTSATVAAAATSTKIIIVLWVYRCTTTQYIGLETRTYLNVFDTLVHIIFSNAQQ